MLTEGEVIASLAEALGGDRVALEGVGDDAALLRAEDGRVIATDALVEGVHFDLRWSSWSDVAFKALATNVSDLWAMDADPRAWLLTLGLPAASASAVRALIDGFAAAIETLGLSVALVGGDTVRASTAFVSITIVGRAAGPLCTRGGARVGQGIYLDGTPGAAELGLRALRAGLGGDAVMAPYVGAHRRPRLRRVTAALRARAGVSAGMDCSDGLSTDVARLAAASGVGCALTIPDTLLSGLAPAAERLGAAPRDLVLHGGDDYGLLVVADAPPDALFTRVGTVEAPEAGLTVIGGDGTRSPLPRGGFHHFIATA